MKGTRRCNRQLLPKTFVPRETFVMRQTFLQQTAPPHLSILAHEMTGSVRRLCFCTPGEPDNAAGCGAARFALQAANLCTRQASLSVRK